MIKRFIVAIGLAAVLGAQAATAQAPAEAPAPVAETPASAASPSSGSTGQALVWVVVFAAGIAAIVWVRRRPAGPRKAARAPPAPRPAPTPTTTQTPDVFISYKRDERPEVLAIARKLEELKLKVWFDAELRSGTSFDTEIDRQVRAAKCVLVCWSPGAVASDWVRGEATIGRQRGVLAAVLLKDCDLPSPFNLTHTDDLRTGASVGNPDWLRMLERIGALVGRPGLAAYAALEDVKGRAAIAAWMADHPGDPLFDEAAARLKASA